MSSGWLDYLTITWCQKLKSEDMVDILSSLQGLLSLAGLQCFQVSFLGHSWSQVFYFYTFCFISFSRVIFIENV